MQKGLLRGLFVLVGMAACLTGCVRPATVTNWSPVDATPAGTRVATLPQQAETGSPVAGETETPSPAAPFIMPTTLPHSMKGYELYSWQQGTDWYFTLFTGTNRSKAFDEIIAPENQVDPAGLIKITVAGLEQVQQVIRLLPAGEVLTWGGMDLTGQVPAGTVYLTYPPQSMIDEIQKTCQEQQVTLQILKEN